MKGIILSGGTGSRLYPLTITHNKQLLPIYDKPMIYYPLSTMLSCGIKDYCLISSPDYLPIYQKLFGNGNHLGINIVYKIQEKPNGIAESFLIAEDFIGNDKVALILGDNIFHGVYSKKRDFNGALIFAYEVNNAQDYAVIELDENDKVLSIEEKPKIPKSKYAIPGLYFFDNRVVEFSKSLKPSPRGELEISDLINIYANINALDVIKCGRGAAWLDAGLPDTFFHSAAYIKTIQDRQGVRIGCIEQDAYDNGFISKSEFLSLIEKMPNSEYKKYLQKIK